WLRLTDSGYGKFSGHVALTNNSGFASVQIDTDVQLNSEVKYIIFRIKGDKKNYEFRLKANISQAESYVHPFETSGEWQTIKIALAEFAPQYRGRKLNSANFNFSKIEQLSVLIANKQEEDFELLLDWIGVE
ncbi:MAG: CIA30 family protein, partial [Flavobacterium sp.]|nr:CIA30 family protein [Flavobacterium sp.]